MIEFLSLKEIGAFSELFLGIAIIYILLFGSLIAYNGTYYFPLTHLSINSTAILVMVIVCFLFYNNGIVVLDYLSFNNTIVNDSLGQLFKLFIGLSVLIYFISIRKSIKSQKFNNFEYTVLVLFATLGLFILCFSNDLITSYLAIELQSLAFYVMAASKRNSIYSVDSGLKYFVLGSFSSGLFLLGSSLIFGVTGSVNFEDFKDLFFWSFSSSSALLVSGSIIESLIKCEEDMLLCGTESYDSNQHLQFLSDKFAMLKQHAYFSTNDARLFRTHFYDETELSLTDPVRTELYAKLTEQIRINMLSDQSFSRNFFFDSRLERRDNLNPFILMWDIFFKAWSTTAVRVSLYSGMAIDADRCFPEYPPYITSLTNGPVWLIENGVREDLKTDAFLNKTKYLMPWDTLVSKKENLNSILNLSTIGTQFNTFFELEGAQPDEFFSIFDTSLIDLGLMFILLSIFLKLALAPFHLWSISVYEGSPTVSAFFFAAISKISLFILLLRLCYSGFYSFLSSWQFYCLIFAVYSVLVGAVGGLEQRKIKSLLAYSAISHMGYCIIALGSGNLESIQMLICYLIIYSISSLCIWSILLLLQLKTAYPKKQSRNLGDLVQLNKSNPILAFITTICLFSMAGLPPMVGFFTKMGILIVVIGISMYIVALSIILFSVISTFYYVRMIKVLYFENVITSKLVQPITGQMHTITIFLALSLILIFLNPTALYLFSNKISLLFY